MVRCPGLARPLVRPWYLWTISHTAILAASYDVYADSEYEYSFPHKTQNPPLNLTTTNHNCFASFCVENKPSYTETKMCLQQTVYSIWSMCRYFRNFTVLLAKCPCRGCVTCIPLNRQSTNKATQQQTSQGLLQYLISSYCSEVPEIRSYQIGRPRSVAYCQPVAQACTAKF